MSNSTDRVIRIKAQDDASANLLTIARAFRGLATVIRQTILFTKQLIVVQELEQLSVLKTAAVYRILAVAKLAAIGLGVGGAIVALAATAAMMRSGANPIAVGQTAPGTSRQVSATGIAVVHAGESIGRGMASAGPVSMTNTFIVRSDGDSPEEVARRLALEYRRQYRSMTSE